jgi:glycosyltransferase involved in cell wall biosynthesis
MLSSLDTPWISVVIPTYNEAPVIAATVAAVAERLTEEGRQWEIVVVDNGSHDGTAAAVRALDIENVRVLENGANRGKGYSVRRGLLDARGELRLLCDADCVPSLKSLGDLLEAARSADVVIGSRLAVGAEVVKQPLQRRLAGAMFLRLSKFIMREPARDIYCGFKLWNAQAAQAVYSRARLDGWVFDAESLALARRLGFTMAEVGIVWVNRPGSRMSMPQMLLHALPELLAARRSVRRELKRATASGEASSAVGASARG